MNNDNRHDLILILDFGAQYTLLIARRLRECGVYCEVIAPDCAMAEILNKKPKGLIFSGGPESVYAKNAPRVLPEIYQAGIPILGICYGQQLMAHDLGGQVDAAGNREYGHAHLILRSTDALFEGYASPGDQLTCWMSHGDKVLVPPAGFQITAVTESAPVAAMADEVRHFYGVQFHPEVAHTPFGKKLLQQFALGPCGCRADWKPATIIEDAVADIQRQVGSAQVICGVSGGVDSCTVAALIHKAIGDQLTCIFVDHGLLRAGEAEQVRNDFAEALGIHLIYADVKERFLAKLKGVEDPEQKRKIIGEEFVRVFEQYASDVQDAKFLAQGTLYPDVIESGGSSNAHTIKTHHNVGGLPADMNLTVIEPLRMLFKDEVRAVAHELGLPKGMVWRHPFPGPGLAIRVIGEVTEDRLAILRAADEIFMNELHSSGWYEKLSQALVVLTPIRSVGVMGDQRTYSHPVVLRAVITDDFMTASAARIDYDILDKISSRIVNEVNGINRVVYDLTSKPPGTIEWE